MLHVQQLNSGEQRRQLVAVADHTAHVMWIIWTILIPVRMSSANSCLHDAIRSSTADPAWVPCAGRLAAQRRGRNAI